MIKEFLVSTNLSVFDTLIEETNAIIGIGKPGDTTTAIAEPMKHPTEEKWIMNFEGIKNTDKFNGNKDAVINKIRDLANKNAELSIVETESHFIDYCTEEGFIVEEIIQ